MSLPMVNRPTDVYFRSERNEKLMCRLESDLYMDRLLSDVHFLADVSLSESFAMTDDASQMQRESACMTNVCSGLSD